MVDEEGESCLPCAENCYMCSETDTCDLCMPGYTRNESGSMCVACS